MLRWAAVALCVVACGDKPIQGRITNPPATPLRPTPAPPGPSANDPGDPSIRSLECLFERAGQVVAVLDPLARDAPAVHTRRAALAAIARARADGETPALDAIRDAIYALAAADDAEGLRTVFALEDELLGAQRTEWSNAPARALAGVQLPPTVSEYERIDVARELAIGGNVAEGRKVLAAAKYDAKKATWFEQQKYVGALVAVGRIDDARAIIASAKPVDRLGIAATWLEVTLRQRAPLADAVAAVAAELATAPATASFGEQGIWLRAYRTGRVDEVVPLYDAVRAWRAKDATTSEGEKQIAYDRAFLLGKIDDAKTLAADPVLATYVALRTGPIAEATTIALAQKNPTYDLARIWSRSLDPVSREVREKFMAAVCPDGGRPRPIATPALGDVKLAVRQVDRGMRQECALHDVAITLSGAATAREELAGECHGACTAKEKRAAQKEVDRIQGEIDAGNASESELDYNFTGCLFVGPLSARVDRVGVRDIALIEDRFLGPHDVEGERFQIALEVCGDLFVSDAFGQMYAHSFDPADLVISETADHQQITVAAKTDLYDGVIYRLFLPACPGTPTQSVRELSL